MNALRVAQFLTLIILNINGIRSEPQYLESNEACEVKPNNLDKVNVLVYVNGGSDMDETWYSRYCAWWADGFPYDTYAPVTVHAGAKITCDQSNKCICPNKDDAEADCQLTFQYVCIERILGQGKFKNFLCCTKGFMDKQPHQEYSYELCVNTFNLADKIAECVKETGPGSPQEIALKNAQEVIAKGADVTKSTEPYFFFQGVFEKCMSDDAYDNFIQKICQVLKSDVARKIPKCVYAMGW